MCKYQEEEILEALRTLDECGADYFVPNKMLQYYPDGVKCGTPEEPMPYAWDTILEQLRLTDGTAYIVLNAKGDSMMNAGINNGDRLTVEITQCYRDGDIVVADIDGHCTAKTFFTDSDGSKWLIPQNDAYDPIPLCDEQTVTIVGIVRAVTHPLESSSYASCARILREKTAPKVEEEPVVLTGEQVEEAVKAIAPEIKIARHWYAVFRVLVDYKYYDEKEFCRFANDVNGWCKDLQHPVNGNDLGKMAVGSFSKPVAKWNPKNAPVSGKRYLEYYMTAKNFEIALLKNF